MFNKSTSPRILFILGTLYLTFYSIYLLINIFALVHTSSLDVIFYGVILITLVGSWGLWNQKKIFNKSFWKGFLIFQSSFSLYYFYFSDNMIKSANSVYIYKTLLFLPLCFLIYFYAFKNDAIWNISEGAEFPKNASISLKNHFIFFIGLILITLSCNPFPQDNLSPAEYNSLGVQAASQGDIAGEKRFYLKGLKAAKKIHKEDTPVVAKIYHNLSIHYDERFNEKASVFYTLKAIAIYEKLLKENKINKQSQEYHMLAEGYYAVGTSDVITDTKKKLLYLNKAMNIFIELKDNSWQANCYQGFGKVYSKNKDYRQSKLYYEKAIAIAKKNKIKDVLADIYKMYADSLFDQKEYAQAEKFAQKAIAIFKKDVSPNIPRQYQFGNAYTVLAKINAAQGKCDESAKYNSIGMPMMNKSVGLSDPVIKRLINDSKNKCEASKL